MKWCAPIFVVVLLVGCGTAADNGTANDQTSSFNTSAPATETTGNESPQPTKATTVSLPLPGLPIGGNAEPTDADATVQCAFVNWSGPPNVPAGMDVSVTDVRINPSDAFVFVSAPCSGGKVSCRDRSFHLTSDGATCALAVKFTGQPTGDHPQLTFAAGKVTCAIEAADECRAFVTAVSNADPKSIQLRQLQTG